MHCLFKFLLFTLLIIVGASNSASASPSLILNDQHQQFELAGHIDYLRDDANVLSLAAFTALPPSSLTPTKTKRMIFGITTSHYWFLATINNQSQRSDWMFQIRYFSNSAVSIYLSEDNGDWILINETARNFPRHYNLPLTLKPSSHYRLAVHAYSPGPDKFAMYISTRKGVENFNKLDNRWMGIFYGGFITLILYNFFVYFILSFLYFFIADIFNIINILVY